MTQNKVFRAILSLVLAIALWAFVVGEIDPVTKVTLSNVEITYLGVDDLAEQGLSMEEGPETATLTLEGNRSLVRPLAAEDVHVFADVSGLKAGEQTVQLTVRNPRGTEVTRIDPEEIQVTVTAGKE